MKSKLAFLGELERSLPRQGLALFVDVDGTISPIVPVPDEAAVTPMCKRALAELARSLPLVGAISGRAAAEVATMVAIDGVLYVGNHGLDRWENGRVVVHADAARLAWAVEAAFMELRPLAALPGVVIEPKGSSLSLHFRQSPDPTQARAVLIKAARSIAERFPVRVSEGRMVIEIRPAVEMNKGKAVEEILARHEPQGALYFGDDRTDVDAFRAIHDWRQRSRSWGACVAVVSAEAPTDLASEADYCVQGVADVGQVLSWLARFYRRIGKVAAS